MAMTMPMSTNTTIAICVQIQVGDTPAQATAMHPAHGARRMNIV
jgi:hypothetical protein